MKRKLPLVPGLRVNKIVIELDSKDFADLKELFQERFRKEISDDKIIKCHKKLIDLFDTIATASPPIVKGGKCDVDTIILSSISNFEDTLDISAVATNLREIVAIIDEVEMTEEEAERLITLKQAAFKQLDALSLIAMKIDQFFDHLLRPRSDARCPFSTIQELHKIITLHDKQCDITEDRILAIFTQKMRREVPSFTKVMADDHTLNCRVIIRKNFERNHVIDDKELIKKLVLLQNVLGGQKTAYHALEIQAAFILLYLKRTSLIEESPLDQCIIGLIQINPNFTAEEMLGTFGDNFSLDTVSHDQSIQLAILTQVVFLKIKGFMDEKEDCFRFVDQYRSFFLDSKPSYKKRECAPSQHLLYLARAARFLEAINAETLAKHFDENFESMDKTSVAYKVLVYNLKKIREKFPTLAKDVVLHKLATLYADLRSFAKSVIDFPDNDLETAIYSMLLFVEGVLDLLDPLVIFVKEKMAYLAKSAVNLEEAFLQVTASRPIVTESCLKEKIAIWLRNKEIIPGWQSQSVPETTAGTFQSIRTECPKMSHDECVERASVMLQTTLEEAMKTYRIWWFNQTPQLYSNSQIIFNAITWIIIEVLNSKKPLHHRATLSEVKETFHERFPDLPFDAPSADSYLFRLMHPSKTEIKAKESEGDA